MTAAVANKRDDSGMKAVPIIPSIKGLRKTEVALFFFMVFTFLEC